MKTLLYLREFLKRERVSFILENLLITERLSREELENLELARLKTLLSFLERKNPFYSRYFKNAGFNPSDDSISASFEILQKLPVVDKQFIKDHFNEWYNNDITNKGCVKQVTSGSTGTPFEFYTSKDYNSLKIANKSRLLRWHGVNRGEKQICYMGLSIHPSFLSTAKTYINNKVLWNQTVVDSTKIRIEEEIERINIEKPISIYGYPSTIFEIALYSLKNSLPIKNSRLKMIIFSGESHAPYVRDIVQKAFGIDPIDEYCTMEGFIAGTCEYQKLHLNEDVLIAEILTENGEVLSYGKGELLVTQLFSFEFPFIRYKTGDIVEVTEERCKCGRHLRTIKSIDGRKGSFILNGNTKLSETAINLALLIPRNFIESIARYQIIQDDLSSITFRIMTKGIERDFSEYEMHVKKIFDKLLVKFEYLENINKDKSGKFRPVINNLSRQPENANPFIINA